MDICKTIATEQRDCAEHGAYESTHREMMGRDMGWSPCPACAEAAEQAKRAEEEQQARQERFAHRIESAHIPPRFADAGFRTYATAERGQTEAKRAVEAYYRSWPEPMRTGQCLILTGNVGNGKTHLACALVRALCYQGAHCRYTTVRGMVKAVRDTWGDPTRSESEMIERFTSPDLLVLDEVGIAQSLSQNEQGLIFEVINDRYNQRRPMVVIGNVMPDELNTMLGERSVDRLREAGGVVVPFAWQSYRKSA